MVLNYVDYGTQLSNIVLNYGYIGTHMYKYTILVPTCIKYVYAYSQNMGVREGVRARGKGEG